MATPQHFGIASKVFPTPAKPSKKGPPPSVSSSTPATNVPTQVICQNDAPILWVLKGALTEVSKRVKENISETWEVRAVNNTPRPGSLMSQAAVSTWIQPEIHSTDNLEGVIRRQGNSLYSHNPLFSTTWYNFNFLKLFSLFQTI